MFLFFTSILWFLLSSVLPSLSTKHLIFSWSFHWCLFTRSLNYYSHLSSRDRGERETWDVFPHREFHLCIIGDYNTLAVSLIVPNILLNIQYKQLQSSSCSGHLFMIGYLKLSNEDRISNKKILFRSILWLDHRTPFLRTYEKPFF